MMMMMINLIFSWAKSWIGHSHSPDNRHKKNLMKGNICTHLKIALKMLKEENICTHRSNCWIFQRTSLLPDDVYYGDDGNHYDADEPVICIASVVCITIASGLHWHPHSTCSSRTSSRSLSRGSCPVRKDFTFFGKYFNPMWNIYSYKIFTVKRYSLAYQGRCLLIWWERRQLDFHHFHIHPNDDC